MQHARELLKQHSRGVMADEVFRDDKDILQEAADSVSHFGRIGVSAKGNVR
jgi:hypothetical protein